MKKSRTFLRLLVFILGFVFLVGISPTEIWGQKKCSKNGAAKRFTFHNATPNPIHIKVVGSDCKEDAGKLLGPGQKIGGSSFVGVVFRVYDLSEKLIKELVLSENNADFKIEIPAESSSSDGSRIEPAEGFLRATNKIRAERNLTPLQLDERLNKACQFLADQMAEVDRGYPVHKMSELGRKKQFRKRNKATQRLKFYGWSETKHFEAAGLDTVADYNLIGEKFARGWAGSKSHSKAFFDKHRTKYNRIGFGVAKAKRGTNRYYACALFARER